VLFSSRRGREKGLIAKAKREAGAVLALARWEGGNGVATAPAGGGAGGHNMQLN